jgi:hypothetical protein
MKQSKMFHNASLCRRDRLLFPLRMLPRQDLLNLLPCQTRAKGSKRIWSDVLPVIPLLTSIRVIIVHGLGTKLSKLGPM